MHIKIGTRSSTLALAQVEIFINALRSHAVDFTYDVIKINTTGDIIQDKKLYEIGGKALFLKELEEALLEGVIDCAVHSMKDVPGQIQEELTIACVLRRGIPNDVLISESISISEIPNRGIIGTSSPRRIAQIQRLRPDIQITDLRGNVGTRIDRWRNSNMDGIILAAAGLDRLGILNQSFCHMIECSEMLPAVGQGAIGVEVKKDNDRMLDICKLINHKKTHDTLMVERGFLEYLQADCSTPLAAFAEFIDTSTIKARFALGDCDSRYYFETERVIDTSQDLYFCGVEAAKELQCMSKTI
jgi:hydroxymethylbilane synthase